MTRSQSTAQPQPATTSPRVFRLRDNDPTEGTGRDVPKRTPFDWMGNPLTAEFARAHVLEDAIYLDTIFKRLYNGSQTFRALLALNPDVARTPAMINVMKRNAGAVMLAYGEVDINPRELRRDERGHVGVFVIAHEYRHVIQINLGASIFDGPTLSEDPTVPFNSLLALNRAMEGDSNAFAATCLYEVLKSEAMPDYQIEAAMAGTTMERIMMVSAEIANCAEAAFKDGHAATIGFDAFFHPSNKDILQGYDFKLMSLIRPFSVSPSPEEKTHPDGFAARFNKMKTMPYLSEDGAAIERATYLEEIDFSVLKTLPHFGITNRLYRMLLQAPPWARQP